MARHPCENDGDEDVVPIDAFRRSRCQFKFNLDRICEKYAYLDSNGKCSGVEIDLAKGEVYAPDDMSNSQVHKQVEKFHAFEDQFTFSKLSAPYNGVEVFGKGFTKRRRECALLDKEFHKVFESDYPTWRPYVTPKKRRLEKTIVRETVKELTFESSMDYFNYVMKLNPALHNIFLRQESVDFVHQLALPSNKLDDSSENSSSNDSSLLAVLDHASVMLLDVDSTTTRESSPSHDRTNNISLSDPQSSLNSTHPLSSRQISVQHDDSTDQSFATETDRSAFFALREFREGKPYAPFNKSSPAMGVISALEKHRPKLTSTIYRREKDCEYFSEQATSTLKDDGNESGFARNLTTIGRLHDGLLMKTAEHESRKGAAIRFSPKSTVKAMTTKGTEHLVVATKPTSSAKSNLLLKSHSEPLAKIHRREAVTVRNPRSSEPRCTRGSQKRKTLLLSETHMSQISGKPPAHSVSTRSGTTARRILQSISSSRCSGSKTLENNEKQCKFVESLPLTPRTGKSEPSSAPTSKIYETRSVISETTRVANQRNAEGSVMEQTLMNTVKDFPITLEASSLVKEGTVFQKRTVLVPPAKSAEWNTASTSGLRNSEEVTFNSEEMLVCNNGAGRSHNAEVYKTVQLLPPSKKRRNITSVTQKKSSNSSVTGAGVKAGRKEAVLGGSRKSLEKTESAPAERLDTKGTKNEVTKLSKKQRINPGRHDSEVLESFSQRLSPASSLTSPVMDMELGAFKKMRYDETFFERSVTPISFNVTESSIWDENIQSIVSSYDDSVEGYGRLDTILGFDVSDVRKQCNGDGCTTLSAFVNCARKFQMSNADRCSVDMGMKEDRRAMAAAKFRNRRLNTGYYA